MKKIITVIAFFVLCISAFCVTNYASATDERVQALYVQTYPSKTVYGAFDEFDPSGLTLRVVYEDGSERIISGHQVTVLYQRDDCLRVGDSSVILSYGSGRTSIPVTVNRIAYDLSALELDSFSVTYNGQYQSYSKMLPSIIGKDGIPLVMSAVGGSVNAGSYDIKLDFYTESRDYILPDTRVVTMTILPYSPEVVWSGESFTYDGRSKLPEAYYYDVNGNKKYPTVTGSAINAGKYTAFATVNDPNYLLLNAQTQYEIKKADYDFSGVIWSEDSFIYNGSKKSISAYGLPEGVSIIGYSGDRAIGAGKYTVTASLSWDNKNYNAPPVLSHDWEILPAEYDMSKTLFVDSEYIFDAEMHYPRLEGRMPTGADGITLQYSFSTGATHVSDGVVPVTITFSTNSTNYVIPKSQNATVKINPKGLTVDWGNSEIFYTGEYNHPAVNADECEIKVEGGGINVGNYIATATTENTDYYIVNDKKEFVIKKATNTWVEMPENSVCYEGRDINLCGKSMFGGVHYVFYSDKAGENRINSPVSCGVYYARIFVNETDNYTGLESEIISFEIVEIVPVSIDVIITKEKIKAFENLSPLDFVCHIVNNDGSLEDVDSSLVSVIYENENFFQRTDTRVDFVYESYRVSLPISVERADYDLSGAIWNDLSPEYDGSPKTPYLSGLPEGITVIEYVGGNVIEAGKYLVSVILKYDDENYNEPTIPPCNFEIRKCALDIPIITAIYNGTLQSPINNSSLYTVTCNESFVNAGDYSIKATLTDSKNYTFKGTEREEVEAVFRILPKTVSATVNDVKKYLFERVPVAEYSINYNQIIDGDELTVEQYTQDGYVYLISKNPNYTLSVTPGKIIRLWYPSLKGTVVIFLVLIILSIIGVLVYFGIKYKEKIMSVIAIARCRWHNRAVAVDPPKTVSLNQVEVHSDIMEKDDTREETENLATVNESVDEEEKQTDSKNIDDDIPYEEKVNDEFEIEISPMGVNAEKADLLISDSLAKNLIKKDSDIIYTQGNTKGIINVDTLSENFLPGEKIDVNSLKTKGLISQDTAYIKVLARGSVDKALSVYANEFSLAAVKMIALTGGEAIKVITMKEKSPEN